MHEVERNRSLTKNAAVTLTLVSAPNVIASEGPSGISGDHQERYRILNDLFYGRSFIAAPAELSIPFLLDEKSTCSACD